MFSLYIWPAIKFGIRVLKLFLFVGLFFSCFMFTMLIVGNASKPTVSGNLAPVAFGNQFLPYRDVTPTISTGKLHGYTEWSGEYAGTWEGIDYSTPEGTPLYAPFVCPCVVSANGFDGWIGPYDNNPVSQGTSYIVLETEDGQYTIMYQHGRYTAEPGSILAPGVQFGTEASIGNSTGPHSHIAIKKNGQTISAVDYDNTALVVETTTKEIVHTGKQGNYGSVLNTYANVSLRMSHYDPSLGGVNCDNDCSTMASGDKVSEWALGKDGMFAAACPQEWPFGTKLRVNGTTFVCRDTGGYINCYNTGDYDPAMKNTAQSNYCWIDTLGSFGYGYGDLVSDWKFIK